MMNVAVDLKPFFQMIFNMYVILCLQIQFSFVHMVVYFMLLALTTCYSVFVMLMKWCVD